MSAISWERIEALPDFKSLSPVEKADAFKAWEDEFTTELIGLGARSEDLAQFELENEVHRFRINNPDADLKNKETWENLWGDYNSRLNERVGKAASVWKDMWEAEPGKTWDERLQDLPLDEREHYKRGKATQSSWDTMLTEDGVLLVSPRLQRDEEAYRKAVMEAEAPISAKAEALRLKGTWDNAAKQELFTELSSIAEGPLAEAVGVDKVNDKTWEWLQFSRRQIADTDGGTQESVSGLKYNSPNRKAELLVPELSGWARKAKAMGVEPEALLDRLKKASVWGSANDPGNLFRRDPLEAGNIFFNTQPKTEASQSDDPTVLWEDALYENEAKRLKLSSDEKALMEAQRAEVKAQVATWVHQMLLDSDMKDAGAIADFVRGRTMSQIASALGDEEDAAVMDPRSGDVRNDYHAYVAAQPLGTPVEDLIAGYLRTQNGRSNFGKAYKKYQTNVIAGFAKAEASLIQMAGTATASVSPTTASRIFDRASLIQNQAGAATSVYGEAPLVEGLATEVAMQGLTMGLVKGGGVLLRPVAQGLAGRVAAAPQGLASRTLARLDGNYRKLHGSVQAAASRMGRDVAADVGTIEARAGAARRAAAAAELRTNLEKAVTASIGTLGTTGVVYGVAGARSGAATFAEAFEVGKQRGLTDEHAAAAAARPAFQAAVMTMLIMKAIPGGTERIFGIQKGAVDASKLTLRQFFSVVKEKGARQALRTPGFKKASAVMAGGFMVQGGREALEEGLDEAFQALNAMTTYNPDMTIGEALINIELAVKLGGIMGSAANIGVSALDKGDPTVAEGFRTPPPAAGTTPTAPSAPVTKIADGHYRVTTLSGQADIKLPAGQDAVARSQAEKLAASIAAAGTTPTAPSAPVTKIADGHYRVTTLSGQADIKLPAGQDAVARSQAEKLAASIAAAGTASTPTPTTEPVSPEAEDAAEAAAAVAEAEAEAGAAPTSTPPAAPVSATQTPGAAPVVMATKNGKGRRVVVVDPTPDERGKILVRDENKPDQEPYRITASTLGPAVDKKPAARAPLVSPPVGAVRVTASGKKVLITGPVDPKNGMIPIERIGEEWGDRAGTPGSMYLGSLTEAPAAPSPAKAATDVANAIEPIAPETAAALRAAAAAQPITPAPETPPQGTPETGAAEKRSGKDSGKVPDVTATGVKGSAIDRILEGDLDYTIKPVRVENGQVIYEVWGNDISEADAIEVEQIDLMDPDAVMRALAAADTEGKAADVREKKSPAPVAAPEKPAESPPKKETKPKKPKDTPQPKVDKAAVKRTLMDKAVDFFLRKKGWPRNGNAWGPVIKKNFADLWAKVGLTTSDIKDVRDRVTAAWQADQQNPDTAWEPDHDQFEEADRQSTNKSRDARMQGKDAFTRLSERANNTLKSIAAIPYDASKVSRKDELILSQALADADAEIDRNVREVMIDSADAENVRAMVAAQLQKDFARLMFAQQLAAKDGDRDAKLAFALKQLGMDPEMEGSSMTQAEAALDKWGKIKLNKPTAKRFVTSVRKDLNDAKQSRKEAGQGSTSLDAEVGGIDEGAAATLGDLVGDNAAAAPDEMADTLENKPEPEEESIIFKAAQRIGVAAKSAAEAAKKTVRALFNPDRSPKPAFKGYMADAMEEFEGDQAEVRDELETVLKFGNQGYLQTKAGQDTTVAEHIAFMIEDLALTGDTASVIAALEKIAADAKKYGQTNADVAADLLNNHKDKIAAKLKQVVLNARKTEVSRGTGTIYISGTEMNSWGVVNGLLEELVHLVSDPLTEAELAQTKARILKARESMDAFIKWIEDSMNAAGMDPRFFDLFVDDLYYSLGLDVVRDANGEIDYVASVDFIDVSDSAAREFLDRLRTDPFTKRALGQDGDFMKGMFSDIAKRRFKMVVDPNSKKGRIINASLQADGDDEKILKDKLAEMAPALGTRASSEPTGFRFKTQYALEAMLADTRGLFASLIMAKDGSVPFQNLEASIRKRTKGIEYDTVMPVIESLKDADGRVSVPEAVEALSRLSGATARIEVLDANATNPEAVSEARREAARLSHEMDTEHPGWRQFVTDEEGAYYEPAELPDDTLSRFSTEFADDYAAWLRAALDADPDYGVKETESATARYTMVNPKPLDQMEDAADVMVEEPSGGSNWVTEDESGGTMDSPFIREQRAKANIKYSEDIHFPTRKNVIGFARTYVETLPDGTKALHVFEVQSDWAARKRQELEDIPGNLKDERSALLFGEDITRIEVSEEGPNMFWVKQFAGNSEVEASYYDHEPTLDEVRKDNDKWIADYLKDSEATQRANIDATSNPYLPAFESLALKAAIQRARSLGIDKLVISDAETAMMTEKHDRNATSLAFRSSSSNRTAPITAGEYGLRGSDGAIVVYDSLEQAQKAVGLSRGPGPKVDQVTAQDLAVRRPTQEPGMLASYDPRTSYHVKEVGNKESIYWSYNKEHAEERARQHGNAKVVAQTGRTHGIMRKLTGDKGVPVDMGVHQNARGDQRVADTPSNRKLARMMLDSREWLESQGLIGDDWDTDFVTMDLPAIAEGRSSGIGNPFSPEWLKSFNDYTNGESPLTVEMSPPQGSPVFKNRDGTPKTNVTGILYDLSKVDNNEVSTLGTREAPASLTTPHVLHTVANPEDIPAILEGIRPGTNVTLDSTKPNQSLASSGITLVFNPTSIKAEPKGYNANDGVVKSTTKPQLVEILVDRDGYPGVNELTQEEIDSRIEKNLPHIEAAEKIYQDAKAASDQARTSLEEAITTGVTETGGTYVVNHEGRILYDSDGRPMVYKKLRSDPKSVMLSIGNGDSRTWATLKPGMSEDEAIRQLITTRARPYHPMMQAVKDAELFERRAWNAYDGLSSMLLTQPRVGVTPEDMLRADLGDLSGKYPTYFYDVNEQGDPTGFEPATLGTRAQSYVYDRAYRRIIPDTGRTPGQVLETDDIVFTPDGGMLLKSDVAAGQLVIVGGKNYGVIPPGYAEREVGPMTFVYVRYGTMDKADGWEIKQGVRPAGTLGTREAPGYHTTTHPMLYEPGRVYVYLRDGNGEVMSVSQVDIQEADEAAKNLMDNKGQLIARHFKLMLEGTLGTRAAKLNQMLDRLSDTPQARKFQNEVRELHSRVGMPGSEPKELRHVNPETDEYTVGMWFQPDWRELFKAAKNEFPADSASAKLVDLLLAFKGFDKAMANRPLYIEDVGYIFRDGAIGRAFLNRYDDLGERNTVYSAHSALLRAADTPTSTTRPAAFMGIYPSDPDFFRVVLHEGVHLLTKEMLYFEPSFKREITGLLNHARRALGETKPGPDGRWATYGLTNVDEFVAEAFSDQEFAETLNAIESKTKMVTKGLGTLRSLLHDLFRIIGDALLGGGPNTVSLLEETAARTYRALKRHRRSADKDTDMQAFLSRLWNFAQTHAPYLGVDDVVATPKPSRYSDERTKPAPVQVDMNLLVLDRALLNQPGEAERLITKENAFAKFRLSLTQSDIDAIRNAPEKAAFLPAFINAAKTPEDAMDLFDKMDDTAVTVLLRHAFDSALAPDFMDAFSEPVVSDEPSFLGTRESMPARIDEARIKAGYAPVRLQTRPATPQYRSRVPVVFSKKHGGWEASSLLRHGRLTKRAFKLDRLRKQAVGSAEKAGRFFEKSIDRFLKTQPDEDVATELVNTALGSTENFADPVVLRQLDQQRKDANKAARNNFLSAYGQVRTLRAAGRVTQADMLASTLSAQLTADIEANRQAMDTAVSAHSDQVFRQARAKQLRAQREIRRLNKEFYKHLVEFRTAIDNLGDAIAADPTTKPDLKASIDRRRGMWLHRTYSLHHDPKWYDRIKDRHPDMLPVIADAEKFVRAELIEKGTRARLYQNRQERIKDPTVPKITEADAQSAAENEINMFPGMVEQAILGLLDYGRSRQDGFGAPSYASTAKPPILKHRKNIPDPIRALWGEIKDPRVNAAQALIAARQRVANKNMLRQLAEEGLYDSANPDKPFYLVRKEDVGKVPGTVGWEPVVSEEEQNEASPLAGLYGPPIVHDALRDVFNPRHQGALLNYAAAATGYSMSTKTTLSVKAWARNFLSNVLLVSANGNLTPAKLRNILPATKAITADLKSKGSPEARAFIQEMIARGVIHDSLVVGLLRELHGDLAASMDYGSLAAAVTGKSQNLFLRGDQALRGGAAAFYQAQDDFWKIISFLGELQSLEKIYAADKASAANDPKALAELDEKMRQEAADIVAATVPTYSHVPEAIKRMRRSIAGVFVAPYVSWPAEIIRVSVNIPTIAYKDIRSSNPERRARGRKRMVWFGVSMSASTIAVKSFVQLAIMVAAGMSDDEKEDSWLAAAAEQPTPAEERAFRDKLPPWSRNATLLFLGRDKETGDWRYLDISFTDPYDYWKRLARSAHLAATTEGLTPAEAAIKTVKDTAMEAVGPFTGEQLLAGSVLDALFLKAPGQYDGAPLVRWKRLDDEVKDLLVGAATGTHQQDSGNLVNGMLHVIESSIVPGTGQTIQNLVKGWTGVREGSRVYDVEDEILSTVGLKVQTLNPLDADMFKFRAAAQAHNSAASRVRDRTFIDSGTAGGANIEGAYNEAMDRQRAILADTRRLVTGLQRLKYGDDEITTSLKEAGFNNSAIDQVMGNYFEKTFPSKNTVTKSLRSPGAKGQNRPDKMLDAYEKYDDTKPLLHE
jgi:hypothetical protein